MSTPSYIQPLSRKARWGVLAAVLAFHAGIGLALAMVQPKALTVGDVTSMEVRMVTAEQPPQPPEPPVQLDVPPPEDTPPPEVPQLESMIQPPRPDLPPPEFPVQAPPPKPPTPKPPPPKPQPPKPHPQQATPAPAPTQPTEQATTAAPQTLSIFQVSYSVRPVLVYPVRERRAGHHGTTQIRAYIDVSGVPQQVVVERSSGYPALDEAAVDAMRKARVNTGGRAFSVTGPFTFNLAE
ncbi:MAG: energy transducer TonB [Reyranellales bacterium]